MKIPGSDIAQDIEEVLKKEVAKVKKAGKTPHLITILIGESPEQLSFVRIKKRVAERLGIEFEFIHLKRPPIFEKFAKLLKTYSHDPKVTGVIIQQPLPSQLDTDSIFKFIPPEKEIECHTLKSHFCPPLGLAVLTVLKYILLKQPAAEKTIIDKAKDANFFKTHLKHKKIVLVGRGITGGKPIGKALSMFKINYINTNSQTHDVDQYYKDADIIISAAGKKIINENNIKPGVILITAGLRHENGKLKGDYDEHTISSLASYYTPTPGGVGPLDVLYLYKNLIDATKLQLK